MSHPYLLPLCIQDSKLSWTYKSPCEVPKAGGLPFLLLQHTQSCPCEKCLQYCKPCNFYRAEVVLHGLSTASKLKSVFKICCACDLHYSKPSISGSQMASASQGDAGYLNWQFYGRKSSGPFLIIKNLILSHVHIVISEAYFLQVKMTLKQEDNSSWKCGMIGSIAAWRL